MKVKELFDRDITRHIDPAVVVSGVKHINQEIDEYIFTAGDHGVTKNIYKFLNSLVNDSDKKTGVWINGYYGSGKSHFIKYLHYLLNPDFKERAFKNYSNAVKEGGAFGESVTIGDLTILKKKLDGYSVEEILFNIDAVSKHDDSKDRITRVLLKQLNKFRGYNSVNIALALFLEKVLDDAGKFEEFKKEIENLGGSAWTDGKNITRYIHSYLDQVLDVAKGLIPALDKHSLRDSITKAEEYTIDSLIDELKDYIANKGEKYRLIFLLDEVSQYIGDDTTLLLNLQTIVENVGELDDNVWIVCTAQQELQNLVDNTGNSTHDFGKILGRFETKISLDSQDAAFITKKRLLEKDSTSIGVLNDFYKANKGDIENQFVFEHDWYQNFADKEDFVLTYPFVPYQFRLISDVFQSFSNSGYVGEGVRNTERSILGITHFSANLIKDEELGYFAPFDTFFNEQLRDNLTLFARNILDRAYNIQEVRNDDFARRVVNIVFMISNLGESQSVNFPANVENISILLMDSISLKKQDLLAKVQTVLNVLVTKNIIQVSEGKYRFLQEDEIEVANLIANTTVIGDDKLDYVFTNILEKIIKSKSKMGEADLANRKIKINVSIDDKVYGSHGDIDLKFSLFDNTPIENLAHSIASNDIRICLSEWFNGETELKQKLNDCVRTQTYITKTRSQAKGARLETLKGFKDANDALLVELEHKFEAKFLETPIISTNQVILPADISGTSPVSKFEKMVDLHLSRVYSKHDLISGYATTSADLKTKAASSQKNIGINFSTAEEEVDLKITVLGGSCTVNDLVKQFEKAPYGWKDISTLDVLLSMAAQGAKRFEWKNDEIDFPTFADKATNSRERDSIVVLDEKVHSQEDIDAFISAINNDIFNKTIIPPSNDLKEAVESFKLYLRDELVVLKDQLDDYEGYPFAIHIKSFHTSLAEIYTTRDAESVMNKVISDKDELVQLREQYEMVNDFTKSNVDGYFDILKFGDDNRSNFKTLDETLIVKSDELLKYLNSDAEPWDKYPQMKKAYKELYEAINDKLDSLKTEVTEIYEAIFEEIEETRVALSITETDLTEDSTKYLLKINGLDDISQLDIIELSKSEFKAKNLKILQDFVDKKKAKASGGSFVPAFDVSVSGQMGPTKIESAIELDDYMEKQKGKLMVKLAKNKKLFLK